MRATRCLALLAPLIFITLAGCGDPPSPADTGTASASIERGDNFERYARVSIHVPRFEPSSAGDNSCIEPHYDGHCYDQGSERPPQAMCSMITASDHVILGAMVRNDFDDIVRNYDCQYGYIMQSWRVVDVEVRALLTEGAIEPRLGSIMMFADLDCPPGLEYMMAIKDIGDQRLITHCHRIPNPDLLSPGERIASLQAPTESIYRASETLVDAFEGYYEICAGTGLTDSKATFAEGLTNIEGANCLERPQDWDHTIINDGGGGDVIFIE